MPGGLEEIHTEVYVYGRIYSFAMNEGVRSSNVTRHWLHQMTKGKFEEYSVTENALGQRFIYDIVPGGVSLVQVVGRLIELFHYLVSFQIMR